MDDKDQNTQGKNPTGWLELSDKLEVSEQSPPPSTSNFIMKDQKILTEKKNRTKDWLQISQQWEVLVWDKAF